MDVGVRELKQHLSELLERASKGELIRVTDRGEPKALIGPVPGSGVIAAGIAAGWLRVADQVPPVPVKRARSSKRVAEVVDEDRGR